MYWNPEVLTRIDAADDLKIAPYQRFDGQQNAGASAEIRLASR